MKKILLLAMAMLLAVAAHAQIQNQIWGLTLGKSTRQDVRNVLEEKGLTIHELDGGLGASPDEGLITFGSCTWSTAVFGFYQGQLKFVAFSRYWGESDDATNTYYQLKDKLDAKYSSYYISLLEGVEDAVYADGVVKIDLHTKFNDLYDKGVTLGYSDVRLTGLASDEEGDDL